MWSKIRSTTDASDIRTMTPLDETSLREREFACQTDYARLRLAARAEALARDARLGRRRDSVEREPEVDGLGAREVVEAETAQADAAAGLLHSDPRQRGVERVTAV